MCFTGVSVFILLKIKMYSFFFRICRNRLRLRNLLQGIYISLNGDSNTSTEVRVAISQT